MQSETFFPPLNPSTRPSGLPEIFDSIMLICHCILRGTTSAVPERGPSAECLLMFCLLFAGQVWSLAGLGDLPDLGAGGHVRVCAVVVHMHLSMCAAPQGAGCGIPQIRRFQPKAWCLGHG